MNRLIKDYVAGIIILSIWVFIFAMGCGKSEEQMKREESITLKKHLEAVVVVETKCSKCHPMDRIHKALGEKSYQELQEIVERMARKPASGINPDDANKILQGFQEFYMKKTEKP